MSTSDIPEHSANANDQTEAARLTPSEREYDRTGFYPSEGKQFRIWALLGWNIGIIVLFAILAAIINYWTLG